MSPACSHDLAYSSQISAHSGRYAYGMECPTRQICAVGNHRDAALSGLPYVERVIKEESAGALSLLLDVGGVDNATEAACGRDRVTAGE